MRLSQAFQIALILGFLFGLLGGLPPGSAAARTVTIGVVRDGPVARGELVPRVEEELRRLVSGDVTIRFKAVPEFDAGWDGARIRTVLENALSDPEVDIVLGAGYVVAVTAARDDVLLSKPFVSASMHRADIPKLPLSEAGRWMKENFSATVLTQRAERDMQELEKVLSLDTLHVGIDSLEVDYLTGLRDVLEDYETTYGFKVILVRVSGSASEVIAGLPVGAEIFYLTEMPRLSVEKRRELIAGLTARGVPTFSMVGHSDVELGALLTAVPDMNAQMVKRVALNISRIIRGTGVSDLPVFMTVDTKVLINGKTAAAVGYYPDFEVLAFARFIHRDALEQSENLLTLEGALEAAERGNVALAIRDADVESAYRSKKRALSPMLPQILGGASYVKDEPFLDTGLFPTELSAAGVRVSQMIFDDGLISDYRSFDRLHESSGFQREKERLDVLAAAGRSYLEFALARVLYKVQVDNVQLTEDNLDLAKVRYEVGYSGKDEVFRWEAELAQGRTQLLSINTTVEAARISLNQVLGLDQNLRWTPEEFEVDPVEFLFLGERMGRVLKNPDGLNAFRELMVEFAYETSPELMAYDKLIEAQEIQYGQRKRKFLLPKLFANFTYDYHINREPAIENARDDTYRFELGATYPVFNGTDRYQDMKLQEALLDGLRQERELARQQAEQRVRTAIRRLESSFPSLRLTRQAAESSRLNLEVVRDKYGQGIVNITDLLEAQNQTFGAEQNAAAATYNFLSDLIRLQRAISWFEYDHTEEERNELARRISEAVAGEQQSP